jgi:hypothetical protein
LSQFLRFLRWGLALALLLVLPAGHPQTVQPLHIHFPAHHGRHLQDPHHLRGALQGKADQLLQSPPGLLLPPAAAANWQSVSKP